MKRGESVQFTKGMTVKDLSKEFETSRQTIYNYLDKIDRDKYTYLDGGILHVSPKGCILIAELLNPNKKDQTVKEEPEDSLIDFLKEQIKAKDDQINQLNRRLEETNNLLAREQELLKNNIIALEATTEEKKALELESYKLNNSTFWQKVKLLFNNKKE